MQTALANLQAAEITGIVAADLAHDFLSLFTVDQPQIASNQHGRSKDEL
jgi:hypothetical protein